MLASTFMDLVVGLDVHFEMVPMPAPTPMPFPHPFMGMVGDLKALAINLIVSNVMEMAMAGELKPPKGPVIINLMPATNTGTDVKNKTVLPHFVIPPGTMWTPMPKAPKPKIGLHEAPPPDPPVAPAGDAVLMMGSKTVTFMGSNAVRFGDAAMSCSEPLRMPSSTVMAIPKGMPVMVGGPPAIDWVQAAGALLRSKWVANELHGLLSRIENDRLRNLLGKLVCFLTGHPVDVATGRVLTWATDWQISAPIPLVFERNYASSWARRDGVLGRGWSHSLDEAVWLERGRVVYRAGDGREIEFDTFGFPGHMMRKGDRVWDPLNRLTLRCLGLLEWEIESAADGLIREFTLHPAEARGVLSRLTRISSRAGHEVRLEYDRRARLEWVHDAGGRSVHLEHDRNGRLVRVALPHPEQEGWVVHTEYDYSDDGDLVSVRDALGHETRFEYIQHLLVRETDRNGLSFYFGYDGATADARCIRTWGDGERYDREIVYDVDGHVTFVTDSLGHTTVYHANPLGAVVKVVDASGGSTSYEYDERTLQKTKETDPAGGETTWAYDARGNVVEIVNPDGAKLRMAYGPHDDLIEAVEPTGGRWQFERDSHGRVTRRVDPLGGATEYHWQGGRLNAVTQADGSHSWLQFDAHHNLVSFRTNDGATDSWEYDRLGRCVESRDARGNVERRAFDAAGRPLRVQQRDGSIAEMRFDPEGSLIWVTDSHRTVSFEYEGRGRLKSRTEAGATISFSYDTEERLSEIRNAAGGRHVFFRGPTGLIEREVGFGGNERRFVRDATGRLTMVLRPDGTATAYAYDPVGRVTQIKHDDGTSVAYSYAPDGHLLSADNGDAHISFERDLLGRIVKETQGEEWVESRRDGLSRRTGVSTSRGLVQRITRDAAGHVINVVAEEDRAGSSGPSSTRPRFEARFGRDPSGLEIERLLPGGVTARWERDAQGRPVRHDLLVAGTFNSARQYHWSPGDRLTAIIDAQHGPRRFEHDPTGALTAISYGRGEDEIRAVDANGNVYRRPTRDDRRYGLAGELLEATGDEGVMRYEHDADGQLCRKIDPDGGVWTYEWTRAGTLRKVVRPDGLEIEFAYDPIGRRISKRTGHRLTHWIWDGHVPVHEWTDLADAGADGTATSVSPTTWLFDPGTFAPLAKLTDTQSFSIATDHLGVPSKMFDESGKEAWSAELGAYGSPREVKGNASDCPFRWPGQYADEETGLSYNGKRYYSPAEGSYISPDPIGLAAGPYLYRYPADPLTWADPWGLAREDMLQQALDVLRNHDQQIKEVFGPDVDYGIRGSMSTGVRYGASKEAGHIVPFNPADFDVDGFIIDKSLPTNAAWPNAERAGLQELRESIENELRAIEGFEGMANDGGLFNFKIFKKEKEGSTMASPCTG